MSTPRRNVLLSRPSNSTGVIGSTERIEDLNGFATTLARFLASLQQIDPADGPPPGHHNFFRGGPLETYDAETRGAIAALGDQIATETATAVWETAIAATWHGSSVWFHGDCRCHKPAGQRWSLECRDRLRMFGRR
jgi:aminoglycoside phosphotransferase (APT) family kinase protein